MPSMSHPLASVIGENVRNRRLAAGRTQLSIAAEAGTDPHCIVDVEGGKRIPTLPTLIGIARAVNATLDELVTETPA